MKIREAVFIVYVLGAKITLAEANLMYKEGKFCNSVFSYNDETFKDLLKESNFVTKVLGRPPFKIVGQSGSNPRWSTSREHSIKYKGQMDSESRGPETKKNIARGKETQQSSTIWGCLSSFGNDGNYIQDGRKMKCSHTNNDRESFWAVDLGQNYAIDSISIYSRNDCCGERQSDYFIDIYNPADPTWTTFDKDAGKRCYYNPELFPSVLNVACDDTVTGRYVKIYKYRQPDIINYLTLCEVDIYTNEYATKEKEVVRFCRQTNKMSHMQLTMFGLPVTHVQCSVFCTKTMGCLGFNYATNGSCSLVRSSTETAEDQSIVYYESC